MMLSLYRGVGRLLGPLIDGYLARRAARGKEDPARLNERYGRAGRARPDGRLVWLHAASVGESVSALPLIERLLAAREDLHVLVTTGTVTSAGIMEKRLALPPLAGRAFHQYVPIDRVDAVRAFLDHWRPDLGLWMESELWPLLVSETAARHVPMVLVNARMSARSFDRWRRFAGLIGSLLGAFDLCLAQSERDGERLRALGAGHVESRGNLKFAAEPLPVDETELARLASLVAGRPLWLAASTHDGEEDAAARVHEALAGNFPGLLTVIAPRHPERGGEITGMLAARGLIVARRSLGAPVTDGTDVYVADTMGELGLFYRLAEVAFIGGSLVPHGGQNPLEAARLGCAILHGPHMENFAEARDALKGVGAAVEVENAHGLAEKVGTLLGDAAGRKKAASAALSVVEGGDAVLEGVVAAILPYLNEEGGR